MKNDLYRAWKRSRKVRGWENQEDIANDMKKLMLKLLPIPQGMAEELADFYWSIPIDEATVYRAEEILEVFYAEWSEEETVLNDEDWDFLRDLVNAWALDMDMKVVNDVLRIVVEMGGFR